MIKQNNTYQNLAIIFLIIAIPIIIYFYFLKWKTIVIYGDDLDMYMNFLTLNSFYEQINLPILYGKFRPIHGLISSILVNVFQKNVEAYYLFNVTIQSINTFVFALIINIFLRSPIYSLLISLSLGLSKFTFFNITQLLNGGALEGLALGFFLLSLFFILGVLVDNNYNAKQIRNKTFLSILFANFSLYTHERYIVILPFLIFIVLFSPKIKDLGNKKKLILLLISVCSIILNVLLKHLCSLSFFVGTGGTNMSFSISNAIQFFFEGILSLFQINIGPEHMVGIPFLSLTITQQILICVIPFYFITIVLLFTWEVNKIFAGRYSNNYILLYLSKERLKKYSNVFILFSLLFLFLILLFSVVFTIRLEPRWLQAPLSLFILIIIIVVTNLQFINKNNSRKRIILIFIFLFLLVDSINLREGANRIYLVQAEQTAFFVKKSIDNGTIRLSTNNIYIWERKKDTNTQNTIKWYLNNGVFFEFYQNKQKKLIFIDSTDVRPNINKETDQIVFIDNKGALDITDLYLQDSLPSYFLEN